MRHHAKEANCTPLRQEVTQSHAEDLRDLLHGMHPGKQPAPKCILSNSTQVCVNACLYMDLYIPPYRINNEQIFTPTKEAVLKQPRTVKAEP